MVDFICTGELGLQGAKTENYKMKNSENCGPPARQQIWPWSRSKVTVKVTTWYHRKGLVTKNTHIKYPVIVQKLWPRLKFLWQTDRQTEAQRDGQTNEIWCPRAFAKAGDKNSCPYRDSNSRPLILKSSALSMMPSSLIYKQ